MGIFRKISRMKKDLENPNKMIAMSHDTYNLVRDKYNVNAEIRISDEIPYNDGISFNKKERR